MEFLEMLKNRRSVRKYSGQKIEDEKVEKVLAAGMLYATGKDAYPLEWIVVRDKDTLDKLSRAKSAGSSLLAGADAAIVVLGNKDLSDTIVEDASISMDNMMIEASEQGLGSCWVQCRLRSTVKEGTDETVGSSDYVRELLNIPENYDVEAMVALGYPERKVEPHKDPDTASAKVHRETF